MKDYGTGSKSLSGEDNYTSAPNTKAASVVSAVNAVEQACKSIFFLAEMAEGISSKISGPQAMSGATESGKPPRAPRGVVDSLHDEISGMLGPLARLENALRDIDERIG
jgi:hypothetical protein